MSKQLKKAFTSGVSSPQDVQIKTEDTDESETLYGTAARNYRKMAPRGRFTANSNDANKALDHLLDNTSCEGSPKLSRIVSGVLALPCPSLPF